MGFFSRCKPFSSLLTRNKPFFISGKGTNKFVLPHRHITPFFCLFCEQTFYFLQFAEQTIFYHSLLNKSFLFQKKTIATPPPRRIIWSTLYYAATRPRKAERIPTSHGLAYTGHPVVFPYCLNQCARTSCSRCIITRCRLTNWSITGERRAEPYIFWQQFDLLSPVTYGILFGSWLARSGKWTATYRDRNMCGVLGASVLKITK